MKPKWLIESDSFWHGQPNRFTPSLDKLGVDNRIIKFRPNGDYQAYFEDGVTIVPKGSLEFVLQLEKIGRWKLAFWDGIDKFKCSTYYSYYGQYMANGDGYFLLPLSEVRRRLQDLVVRYGHSFFVRPDSGGKEFTGHVTERMMPTCPNYNHDKENLEKFNAKLKKLSYGDISPEEMVMVAHTKVVDEEYRFFIIDREVVAGCTYIENGSHEEKEQYPQEAFELADKIAKIEWRPAVAFTVDICKMYGGYKVLEINSFNCSDIYSCNPEHIIKKANDYIEKMV